MGLVVANYVLEEFSDNEILTSHLRTLRWNDWIVQEQRDLLVFHKFQEHFLRGFHRAYADTAAFRVGLQSFGQTTLAVLDLLFLSGYIRVRKCPCSTQPVAA